MLFISTDTATGLLTLAVMGLFGGLIIGALYEEDWWEDREKEVDVFVLRLHRISTVGRALLHLVSFGFGLLMLIFAYLIQGLYWLIPLLIIIAVLCMIPAVLYINHLFHEVLRTVRYDRMNNRLLIEKSGVTDTMDLSRDDYQIIEYKPRGREDFLPGAGFGKIKIVYGNKQFTFSEMLFRKHERVFTKVKQGRYVKVVRKQFNVFI